jgi:hypothetical protein
MTIFVEQIDTSGALSTAKSWSFYGAEDEDGTRLQTDGGYCSFGPDMMGITLRAWPRRQSHFRLRFLDEKANVIGVMRVHNPVKGPFPVWEPEPIPQSRTNGPVIVTLRSVRASRPDSPWPAAVADWRVQSTDPQWRSATIRSTTFYDATGNEGQWLPRSEPAWKAVALVYRKSMDDFPVAERIMVENVALPRPSEFVGLDRTFDRNGVKITLHVLGGAGRLYVTNGLQRAMVPAVPGEGGRSTSWDGTTRIESWGSKQPFIMIETQGEQDGDVLELIVRDDQGQEIKVNSTAGYSSSGSIRVYLRGLSPSTEAKSVTVEMALNRPLPFEFLFSPQVMEPARTNR